MTFTKRWGTRVILPTLSIVNVTWPMLEGTVWLNVSLIDSSQFLIIGSQGLISGERFRMITLFGRAVTRTRIGIPLMITCGIVGRESSLYFKAVDEGSLVRVVTPCNADIDS